MTNEQAVLVVETHPPINFKCLDAGALPKGTPVKLSNDMTVALAEGDRDLFAGITAVEKIANDGVTSVGVYRNGIFKVRLGASVTIGQTVTTSAANGRFIASTDAAVGSTVAGIALEGGDQHDYILVELNIGANPIAYPSD
jgi:hypothetical protein